MVKRTLNYFGLIEYPPRTIEEVVGTSGLDLKSKVYIYGSIALITITTIGTYIITK